MPWKPDYITVAQASAFLRIPVGDALDDVELQVWVTSASRAVDEWCGRQFGVLSAPAARSYDGPTVYNPRTALWEISIDDVQTSTGMLVGAATLAASGAVLLPRNAPAEGRPWTRLGFTSQPALPYAGAPAPIVVTATWGWTAVPVQVTGAVRLQMARWNWRRNAPAGIAGSPESGSEMRLLARLDPDVKTTLVGLRRRRGPA